MNIKELKEVIEKLPDDVKVYVHIHDTLHELPDIIHEKLSIETFFEPSTGKVTDVEIQCND